MQLETLSPKALQRTKLIENEALNIRQLTAFSSTISHENAQKRQTQWSFLYSLAALVLCQAIDLIPP